MSYKHVTPFASLEKSANSSMDRQKMQGITKTAFAMLEKEAGGAGKAGLSLVKTLVGAGMRQARGRVINVPAARKFPSWIAPGVGAAVGAGALYAGSGSPDASESTSINAASLPASVAPSAPTPTAASQSPASGISAGAHVGLAGGLQSLVEKIPSMPAMGNIAPLGGSVGSMYGQTTDAPSAAPVSKPTGMPTAGTPGMATDGRMHAQNKLNPSAGGTVAVQKAPNAEDIAAFRKQTGTRFNSKSKMDLENMRRLMGGKETIDRKQYGRTQQLAGSQFDKTAFAQLEKVALARGVSKILDAGGQLLRGSARKAKSTAGRGALNAAKGQDNVLGSMDAATKLRIHQDASGAAGNIRASTGRSMRGAAKSIDESKGIQNAINYGAGTIAGGGALYGAHSMGHSSGRESGVIEGTEKGMELGMQGALAMQPGDPGFFGRLGDLFTGTQSGPNAATMRQGLLSERDKLVKAILAG